jgi:xylulokinase
VWLGVDIGTSAIRVAAHDRSGRRVAGVGVERPPRAPTVGALVHDPEADWWQGTCEALLRLWRRLDPERVAGLGLASLFPAFCLVDAEDRSIGEGILFGDTRGRVWTRHVEDRLGVALLGDEVSQRLLWLEDGKPGFLSGVGRILGPAGLVCLRLTGTTGLDPHSAVRWGGIARDGSDWDTDALGRLSIPARLLPPIRRPTEVVGSVTEHAAGATGLPAGIPVVMGATDSFCQLLGCGVSRPGDALVYYGSTGTLMTPTVDFARAATDAALFGPDVPYRLAAYLPSCGTFLDHVRVMLLGAAAPAELDAEAAGVDPGSDGLLAIPWLQGREARTAEERADRGAALVGFTLAHGRGHLWRAALEAFGYILSEAAAGPVPAPRHVWAAGGGSVSAVWRSIVSDQTGWTQSVAPDGGAARGAAFLAALGTGAIGSFDHMRDRWLTDDALDALAGDRPLTEPDPDRHAQYRDWFDVWLAARVALAGGAQA